MGGRSDSPAQARPLCAGAELSHTRVRREVVHSGRGGARSGPVVLSHTGSHSAPAKGLAEEEEQPVKPGPSAGQAVAEPSAPGAGQGRGGAAVGDGSAPGKSPPRLTVSVSVCNRIRQRLSLLPAPSARERLARILVRGWGDPPSLQRRQTLGAASWCWGGDGATGLTLISPRGLFLDSVFLLPNENLLLLLPGKAASRGPERGRPGARSNERLKASAASS